jgi:hypothetical protein
MGTPNRYYSSTATRTQLTMAISSTATLLAVASTLGLPDSTPFTLVLDAGTASEEIVTVTSLSGLNLTVVRGEDGTSGSSHAIGCEVRHAATARDFREPQEHIAATADVHGVTGGLVGAGSAQTLSNKTLDDTNLFVIGGTAQSLDAALANAGGSGAGVVAFSIPGGLGTSVGAARIYNDTGKDLTFGTIRATCGTAPTGSAVIVDVNLNGTTIFTTQANRPTVAAGTNTDTATADITTWTAGGYLTVDVDQVGSTVAGSDLVVQVSAQ